MATSNKIERAYTSQDVKAQECAIISKDGSDINSIDESDTPNKLLMDAKPTQFWGRRLELGNPFSKPRVSWSMKLEPKLTQQMRMVTLRC